MRPKLNADPVAVTSSGELLVNVTRFDDVETLDDAVAEARRQKTPVFIGVALTHDELPLVTERVDDAVREAAAFIYGRRRRRLRRR